jgi:hypothetical protein
MGFSNEGLNYLVDTGYSNAGDFVLKITGTSDEGPEQKSATVTFGSASISSGFSCANLSATETFTFANTNTVISAIELYDSTGSVKLAEKTYDEGSEPTLSDGGEVDVTIFRVKLQGVS